MNQAMRRRYASLNAEGLELRSLRTGGVASALNVIDNLGTISPAVAIAGTGLTASIQAGGSVTFVLHPQVAGQYKLLVESDGDPVTLMASGPSGSAKIPLAPAGKFATVTLDLQAVTYALTASDPNAKGSGSSIDWEFFLNSGVSQGPTVGASVAAPSVTIPLPTLTSPSALSATPSSSAPSLSPSSANAPSSGSGMVIGALVGRTDLTESITPVGPTIEGGSTALAFAGDTLPPGLRVDPANAASPLKPNLPPTAMLAVTDDLSHDEAAIAGASWWDRMLGSVNLKGTLFEGTEVLATTSLEVDAGSVALTGVAAPKLEDPTSNTKQAEQASIGLELIAGIAIGGATLRRWRGDSKVLPRRKTPCMPDMTRNWNAPRSQGKAS